MSHLKYFFTTAIFQIYISYSSAEISVIGLFVFLVLSWFFRRPGFMPGWADLPIFKEGYIGASSPTMIVLMALFLIPLKPECCSSDKG
jgi:hypothetical protein